MRLKDFDQFVEDYCGKCHSRSYCEGSYDCDSINAMDLAPTIDAVPVVQCKDCQNYEVNGIKGFCCMSKGENWFCADGVRKEDKQQ